MKKIGLIGGMSWESTQLYYKLINQLVNAELGGYHSAKCILESVDFAEIEKLQRKNDWNQLSHLMVASAKNLEKAGAELIVICTNTMHLCSDVIIENISVPFIHIAAATGIAIKQQELNKVLLLGTKFTMEKDFYKQLLRDQFQIDVLIPSKKDMQIVHDIIYKELVHGKFTSTSKEHFIKIIQSSINIGAEGVVLGCTEIPLLINQNDVTIPVFDTTKIHAEYIVSKSLE